MIYLKLTFLVVFLNIISFFFSSFFTLHWWPIFASSLNLKSLCNDFFKMSSREVNLFDHLVFWWTWWIVRHQILTELLRNLSPVLRALASSSLLFVCCKHILPVPPEFSTEALIISNSFSKVFLNSRLVEFLDLGGTAVRFWNFLKDDTAFSHSFSRYLHEFLFHCRWSVPVSKFWWNFSHADLK